MEVEELYARFRDIKHGIRARKPSTSIHFGDHKSGFKGAGYDIVGKTFSYIGTKSVDWFATNGSRRYSQSTLK